MTERYTDRARAESFGSVAELYDRHRPTACTAAFDDLAADRPAAVLDIACGTGKIALGLACRGLSVLGVELDPRMAAIASAHGLDVEIGAFETWDDAGRTFDLITCGSAWHWINPALGIPKVARLLRPGGTMARLWNYHVVDEPMLSALQAVYDRHAPSAHTHARSRQDRHLDDPFASHDEFSAAEVRTYDWARTLTADEWSALAATYSDHQALDPAHLRTVQRALRAAINEQGGVVHAHGHTQVAMVHRK